MTERKVYRRGDPEPGPEVQALLDHKNEVWERLPDGRFNCPGNEPHTWDEMNTYCPAFVVIPSYRATVVADAELRGIPVVPSGDTAGEVRGNET